MPSSETPPSTTLYPLRDIEKTPAIESAEATSNWKAGLPIAIDLGTHHTRVGYTSGSDPSHEFFTQVSKFRERRQNKSYTLVGNDIYLDSTARQTIKSPFDGPFLSNWDVVETIFDYSFSKLSIGSTDRVDNPILLSELVGCPAPQRNFMNELLFEGYNVPSVSYGIDSLFSFYYNNENNYNDNTGLVISCGHESTNIIPVHNGRGLLAQSKRINWGGKQSSNYLQALLALKYPYFPLKLTSNQSTYLVHDHCYISKDYEEETSNYLEFSALAEKERVIQAPFTEVVVQEKSEEELRRITEQRKEAGRRLQEQVQKKRLEKLVRQEEELKYYSELRTKIVNLKTNKREIKRLLDTDGLKDENSLQKIISDLEKSIRKGRKLDIGDEEEQQDEEPKFPLLDVADDDLDEEQIKEKRKQRLLKASYDARVRAKEEKLVEEKRLQEEARKDAEWRENDLEGWIKDRRNKLETIIANQREKQRLREELSNRKSLASQMRMKSIAALASENRSSKRRRVAGAAIDDDPDDTFGANDDDWAVYRRIANASDSEEEEEEKTLVSSLQNQLLEYDPTFSIEDTQQTLDWRKSTIHLFLRGPHEFDPESRAQSHQLNLNIERIRVPEVLFQPSIAGVDQAGIVEICGDILSRHSTIPYANNIFLHGGQANFLNFEERLQREFRSILPVGTPLTVRKASNLSYDAWRGMAKFSRSDEFQSSAITRSEYLEMGAGYIKEHRLGNALVA